MNSAESEADSASQLTQGLAALFALIVVIGAVVWWLHAGRPSMTVDADSLVVGIAGLILLAVSLVRVRLRVLTVVALAVTVTVLGLAIAHTFPGSGGRPVVEPDRLLGGSLMLLGALGHLIVAFRRLASEVQWTLWAVAVAGSLGWLYLVVLYSRDIAIA